MCPNYGQYAHIKSCLIFKAAIVNMCNITRSDKTTKNYHPTLHFFSPLGSIFSIFQLLGFIAQNVTVLIESHHSHCF